MTCHSFPAVSMASNLMVVAGSGAFGILGTYYSQFGTIPSPRRRANHRRQARSLTPYLSVACPSASPPPWRGTFKEIPSSCAFTAVAPTERPSCAARFAQGSFCAMFFNLAMSSAVQREMWHWAFVPPIENVKMLRFANSSMVGRQRGRIFRPEGVAGFVLKFLGVAFAFLWRVCVCLERAGSRQSCQSCPTARIRRPIWWSTALAGLAPPTAKPILSGQTSKLSSPI